MLDNVTMLSEVTAMSGSELTIPCGLTLGSPPAKVKWFKDNIEVIQSDEFKIESSGMLLIKNATVENRGSYQCFAENVVGNISRSYDILIFGKHLKNQFNFQKIKGYNFHLSINNLNAHQIF